MLKKITEENFIGLDPNILLDPRWYQDIEDMIISIESANTPDYANTYAEALADKLDVIGDKAEPKLFTRYIRLLKALELFSLVVVSDSDKEKFFRENILDVLHLPFIDVGHWVEFIFISYFNDPEIIAQLRSVCLKGLEENRQLLGGAEILISGQELQVKPTLKNWFMDYNASTPIRNNKNNRGTLEELTYINNSSNVRKLISEDRDILMKILKISDRLRYGSIKYDFSVPGEKTEESAILPEGEHVLIPQDLVDVVNSVREKSSKKAPVVVKTSQSQPSPITPRSPAVNPTKMAGSFEAKLAQVSAPTASHGVDLEVLRKKIEDNKQSFSASVKSQIPKATAVSPTPNEMKREVETKELPGSAPVSKPVQPHVNPYPVRPISSQSEYSPQPSALNSLNDIKIIDDLKKVDLANLRQGELYNQMQTIKSKILQLAQANRVVPYYAVVAFEQSPLFKLYLSVGGEVILDSNADRGMALKNAVEKSGTDLTLAEFESIADLRKEIERL